MTLNTSQRAPTARRTTANLSIGGYLIQRLRDYGIHDLFGIPGDYVLSFYSELEKSPINVIGCTREDCAGFAADAYARLNGMGALCVTYCVGGLSVCNSIAGAYAEKSPIVVISGAPGLRERKGGALLHHMVRDFRTQIEVFEKFTIAGAELSDPLTAFSEIDRVLDACDRFKRPVYIELPRDMVHVVPPVAHGYAGVAYQNDPDATAEAIRETRERLASAKSPIIVAGVEIHRFGLQDEMLRLAEGAEIPIAATMLGKSVVSERHPLFVGLYEGAIGDQEVTQFVEQSDLVLLLGAFLSDINLGIYTAKLDPNRCVYATSEQLRVSHHHYHHVDFREFLSGLNQSGITTARRAIPDSLKRVDSQRDDSQRDDSQRDDSQRDESQRDDSQRDESQRDGAENHRDQQGGDPNDGDQPGGGQPGGGQPLRTSRMIRYLNQLIDADTIVIADVGDALFAATELTIHDRGEFLSPAYYTSMGFSVPAALGAATARPDHRIVVLVGDGAFQMTGQELSTLLARGHNPIVIVLDNHGYGTERYLHKGDWNYNEIPAWDYCQLMKVYGRGASHLVDTEATYRHALRTAWEDRSQAHLIQAKLMENDASDTLKKLAARMGEQVG